MKNFYMTAVVAFVLISVSIVSQAQQTAIIRTERSGSRGIVSFSQSSTLNGISNTRHIDGYVEKNGNGAFVFPVGHKGVYRPFAAEADGVVGAYFQENAALAALPAGGPFVVTNKENTINMVTTKEFWDIDGSNASRITLTWNEGSEVGLLTGNSLPSLTIAGWNLNTSKWEKIASAFDELSIVGGNSTLSTGSITSFQSIVPNTYSIYTLAALTDASAPVNFEGSIDIVSCSEIKGWIWNKNYQDAALTVELVEGNTVYATAVGNLFRQDLQTGGVGTGKYGFNFSTPASLLDGATHPAQHSCKREYFSSKWVAQKFELRFWG
jgi:hypothetical protein